MIQRELVNTIKNGQKAGFINLIYGPRRVGKTILLQQLSDIIKKPGVWFNGDHQETRDALSNTSYATLKKLVEHNEIVFIDEAQKIPNIGLSLKILVDSFPEKTFMVTGSSSLALSRGLQEPLTGRTIKYHLYPLSVEELTASLSPYQKSSMLDEQLIFGGYPYLQKLTSVDEKRQYLKSIIDDYLFRDVLELKDISSPENLKKLSVLLAFQVGSEVSLNELSVGLNIDIKTVVRYLTLLKQSFVIFELGAFSRNLRKEVVKSKKYYFWDMGIRNALTDQFLAIDVRPDTGQLWENFLAVERMKKHEYQKIPAQYYFWRTYEQAEVDWIEITNNKINAFEFKFGKTKPHTPKSFKQAYKTNVKIISKDNYLDFVFNKNIR